MSTTPPSSHIPHDQSANSNPNNLSSPKPTSGDHNQAAPPPPSTTPKMAKGKLRKIPHIPIRRTQKDDAAEIEETSDEDDDEEESDFEVSSIINASSLGLNHIRTRSAPSPLRFSLLSSMPSNLGDNGNKGKDAGAARPIKRAVPHHPPTPTEQGENAHRCQSRYLKVPSPLNPLLEFVPRKSSPPVSKLYCALQVDVRREHPEVKSFSHELNSKGVRPYPFWKPRAFGHMEEIMVIVRAKFDKLKEEVNFDLGIFAGDLVGILEKTTGSHTEWKEKLEDLLVVARQCAKMSPNEFWLKCEGIVQGLDDRRQELPMGILKQAHTRLLFILTRCTRLVQFQKESGYEEDHIRGLHQLSDLGVYPEQLFGAAPQDFNSMGEGKEVNEKQMKRSHVQEQSSLNMKQDQADQTDQTLSSGADGLEVSTAKSVDSSTSSYRMSSWKKLPSAAEKNQRKGPDAVDTPSKDELDRLQVKYETKTGADDILKIWILQYALLKIQRRPQTYEKFFRDYWGIIKM
ncbi:hypothetical protein L1049_019375 [Liquidambar formosana]|uniref:IREH1/IRE-like N-terminal domain-containing protein n=1 Tax=Liquidambar formosana TaxID=63359 RepID=A0AAP0X972_LIQFO